jgi:SSS family solute:Na+ symporter
VLVLGAAYVIVVLYDDLLVWLLLFAYGPITQFMPGLVAALYSRRATAAGVLAGLSAGILLTLAYSLRPEWRPWDVHAGLYGLVVNVALLALVSARTQPRDRARDDEFLRIASTR